MNDPTAATTRTDQIQAEQTRVLFGNCPIGVIGATILAVMLSINLHGPSAQAALRAYQWSALVAACALAHLALCVRYRAARSADGQWRRWNNAFTLLCAAEGLVWCLGMVWLLADANALRAMVLLLAWSGAVSAAIVVFGAFMRTYLVFFLPAMVPHFAYLLRHPFPFSGALVELLGLYVIILPVIVYWLQRQMIEAHILRFENFDLAEDMRRQKDRADQANRSKSSFLAAASHDLRQPVHALGLFIGALRGRAMDEEARRLVDHIDDSVGAMDDLFASLLDISKLDAGTIQPSFTSVEIGPLLARLCGDYVGEAEAKEIALRWVAGSLVVRSDPMLIERILRNLISNAVRYTTEGGVVVGSRRRGETVIVEVWDSGSGIAPDQQKQIFEEFFQVGNPERDRTKGLGLGLAIVKRLSVLMDAPLSFISVPGRGSVFRLGLPRAEIEISVARASTSPATTSTTGDAMIVVIDDERAIQQAMESLLSNWGYRVTVAGSGAEMLARLDLTASVPDLIICDYRLRGAETGVSVIAQLRSNFDRAIPAMLITGDTAPDRLIDAKASGLLLLHKPLPNARLRAAVGNLLRAGKI